MASITKFLAERLRLTVTRAESAVGRPWARAFLGYTVTAHKQPRLRVAVKSVERLRAKLRTTLRQGRGRPLAHTIEDLAPVLRGWMQYFRLAEAKGIFEDLDGWMRRKLRGLL
ncbi:MAG: group II intron maturase-specific domain-containing protein [Stellaceae bacterium]